MIAPELVTPSASVLVRAGQWLRAGRLVAFPTETVYGLGADATNPEAVAAIFAAKGRPSYNPLIVHCAGADAAARVAVFDERASILAETLWPGPLTLVLPVRPEAGLAPAVTAGLGTVAVRVPAHPTAHGLLLAAGCPVAAPSANRSGGVSPTTPQHVVESLGSAVAMVLAAGRCAVGLESTILGLCGPQAVLLRPGAVTLADLEALIGPVENPENIVAGAHAAPSAPGQLASHYAPHLPVRLNAATVEAEEALLAFGPDAFVRGGRRRLNLSPGGDLHEAAANLYAMLRALDDPGCRAIAVMPIPDHGIGLAINDRLRRAAAPRETETP